MADVLTTALLVLVEYFFQINLAEWVENPCVSGSIAPGPPRNTKTTFGRFFIWAYLVKK